GRKCRGGRGITEHLHHEIGVHFCLSRGIEGWKLDHQKRRASAWWQRRQRLGCAIVFERQSRRHRIRCPKNGRWGASASRIESEAAIEQRNCLVASIECRHDTADVSCRSSGTGPNDHKVSPQCHFNQCLCPSPTYAPPPPLPR